MEGKIKSNPTAFTATSKEPVVKVQVVPSDSTDNPKHIYVNVSARNDNTFIGIPAQLQLDFDQPFLKDVDKYYLSIVKATFPTTSLPLFNFPLAPSRPFGTAVGIGTPSLPTGIISRLRPITIAESVSVEGVYPVGYYQQYLDSVNVAFLEAFCQIIARDSIAVPPYYTEFAGTMPPFMIYDNATSLFKVIVQKGAWFPELPFTPVAPGALSGAALALDFKNFRLFNGLPSFPNPANGNALILITEDQNGNNQTNGALASNPVLNGMMNLVLGGLPDNRQWNPLFIYNRGSIVSYNGNFYASTIENNKNITPPGLNIPPFQWQLMCPVALDNGNAATIWNIATTYTAGNIVYYPTQNSVLYVSLNVTNLGNVPLGDPVNWRRLEGAGYPTVWNSTTSYVIGQNVIVPSSGPSGTVYTALTNNTGVYPGDVANIGTDWDLATIRSSNVVSSAYPSVASWSDVESIVIQTGSLPIRYEVFPPPQGDNPQLPSSASQVPRPVLTDLDIFKDPNGPNRSPVQYVPPGNYRMVDLLSRAELKRIDVNIQIKHSDLSFTDLIMVPGDYFAIKFLFIRNDAVSLV